MEEKSESKMKSRKMYLLGMYCPPYPDMGDPIHEAWQEMEETSKKIDAFEKNRIWYGPIVLTASEDGTIQAEPVYWEGTLITLDKCQEKVIHATPLSEVEVRVVRGEAEVKVNGDDLGSFTELRASGTVVVHALEDGTEIRYKKVPVREQW